VPNKDGKVGYEWIDPRFDGLAPGDEQMVCGRVLDPDMSTQNRDKFTVKAIGDIAGVSVSDMTMQFPQWNERMNNSFLHAKWEGITAPQGPYGDQMMEREQPTENIHYAITRIA
jgi:hypothetical protein